jgi:hypothetical protein
MDIVNEAVGLRGSLHRTAPRKSFFLMGRKSTDAVARTYGAVTEVGAAGTVVFMSCPID